MDFKGKRMKNVLSVVWLLFMVHTLVADVATPDYEIKFYLHSEDVLQQGSYDLLAPVANFFAVYDKVDIVMEFLDSYVEDLYAQGWIVRIRNREDKDKLDLAYKYRIPITTTIDDALQQAEGLGWDSDENDYDYQVDWGYNKQTLSITRKRKEINVSGVDEEDMELPEGDKARDTAKDYMPGKLEKWGERYLDIKDWAEEILEEAHIYGPVTGERNIGEWSINNSSIKLYIEVWSIDGTMITELSFKVDSYQEAQTLHQQMKEILDDTGWLLTDDISKTRMILDAYK